MKNDKKANKLIALPMGEEYLKNRNFHIETLIKFQIESTIVDSEGNMYMKEIEVNYTRWAKYLGITRSTLRKNIKQLQKIKVLERFIGEDNKEYYKISRHYIGGEFLFEEKFLRRLIEMKMKHLLKVYLVYYKHTMNYKGCTLTQGEILDEIGLSGKSNGNKALIKNINDKLVEFNLIKVIKEFKHKNRMTRLFSKIITC